ncbi:MAG TPA: hypothetical protein VHH88_14200 [Verrucomicrobiae bacterium]|nr:hypothetical protein [Verrucomicrobiae bacterium]
MPQDPGFPVQEGAESEAPLEEANTESFLLSFVEPQRGHCVPRHSEERTRISLSALQDSQ